MIDGKIDLFIYFLNRYGERKRYEKQKTTKTVQWFFTLMASNITNRVFMYVTVRSKKSCPATHVMLQQFKFSFFV